MTQIRNAIIFQVLGCKLPLQGSMTEVYFQDVNPSYNDVMFGGYGERNIVHHYVNGEYNESFVGQWGGPGLGGRSDFHVNFCEKSVLIWDTVGGAHPRKARRIDVPSSYKKQMLDLNDKSTPIILLSPKQFKALEIMKICNSSGRKNEFQRENLGTYDIKNPFVLALQQLGLVSVNGRGASVLDNGVLAYEANYRFNSLLKDDNVRALEGNARIEWLRGFIFEGHEWKVIILRMLENIWGNDPIVVDYINGHQN